MVSDTGMNPSWPGAYTCIPGFGVTSTTIDAGAFGVVVAGAT